jgi:hypothetical protein
MVQVLQPASGGVSKTSKAGICGQQAERIQSDLSYR